MASHLLKSTMVLLDGVAEHAILRGTPDQLLGDEVLQRIANMTEDGIKAAGGPETPDDVKFKNLLDFLWRGMLVFKSTTPADYDINYQTLVRGVARGIIELDDVYASIFYGVMKVSFVSVFSEMGYDAFLKVVNDEIEKFKAMN